MMRVASLAGATFDEFAKSARAQGYDEVIVREWAPGTELETHRHPFAVSVLVVEGEMWLQTDTETRHLRPGDRFELQRDVPHAERYGESGATYWVARRNA